MANSLRFTFIALLVLVASVPLYGQATATITGTVTDSSGAVIPAARVTATNTDTNLTRSVVADSDGSFVITFLPVGHYEVRMEKDGFAPHLQKGILLQANTRVQADAALQVRGVSEQLTVGAEAAMVQTTSSTLVQVVDSRRVADLPLNGRNVLQLMALNSGVMVRNVPSSVNQTANLGLGLYYSPVSVNGGRGEQANFLLDSADHNESHTNTARAFPNVDAMEEVSIQSGSFDAQYGRGSGAVVNGVTKSGTNQFHGSAFEFLRNFKMNAANPFTGRDALKRNQFGGGIGGPIRKDRTFFFFSYQGTRFRTSTPGALRTAPSAAMRAGNFSEWLAAGGRGRIRVPNTTNEYFPGNIIPRSLFDPVSAKILDRLPTSTDATYQVRFGTPVDASNDNQYLARIDHSIGNRHRISGRYFGLRYTRIPVIIPDNLLYATDGNWGTSHSGSINHTYTISPRWLNNLNFVYNNSEPSRFQANEPDVTLPTLGARVKNVPGINLLVVNISGWSGIPISNGAETFSRSWQISNNVGYTTGRHNLKFGIDVRSYQSGFYGTFGTGGTAGFTGQFLSDPGGQVAGHAYAEFMLGVMGSWSQLSINIADVRHRYYAGFVQDDIRLTRKLTLNVGLRYDPKMGLDEASHQHTTFIPGQRSTVFPNAPVGLNFYGDPGVGETVIRPDWNNLAPRIGLAYQIAPRTVVRAAYGIFYDDYRSNMYNSVIQAQPWSDSTTLVGPLKFSDPYGGGSLLDPEGYRPTPNLAFRDNSGYNVPTNEINSGYTQSWNLLAERQLASDLLVRAAYVGSKGTDLMTSYQANPGIYGPGATASNLNARRPYPRVGSLSLRASIANSNYHSLQLTAQKRYARGFSLLVNYTWAKSIDQVSDDGGLGPDPFDFRASRGPSDFDVTQRFVTSGILDLPRLEKFNPWLRAVLGGWQSNAILSIETGLPLTVRSGLDNNFDGVSGDYAGYLGGDWRLPDDRPKQDKILRWFDKSVFGPNRIGTVGDTRRGQLRGPGFWNVDYSVFKNFSVREAARVQFRAEFFNVFNHSNLGSPNTSANSPNIGVISSASDPRIVQLALKFIF